MGNYIILFTEFIFLLFTIQGLCSCLEKSQIVEWSHELVESYIALLNNHIR